MDTPSPTKTNRSEKASPAFDALSASELFWQPYRSMSRALLLTHQNLSAYMEINRSLVDEMQAILRRSQDMVVQLSGKTVSRMSSTAETSMSLPDVEEMYDFAIAGIRELGDAAIAAQIRSIEALRDHAKSAMTAASETKRKKD